MEVVGRRRLVKTWPENGLNRPRREGDDEEREEVSGLNVASWSDVRVAA